MMMDMTPLHKTVAGMLSAIFLAGALAGCGEDKIEKTRRQEFTDRAVATALKRCDTQDNKLQEIPYEARLRLALKHVGPATLDKLEKQGVAICLDQRLPPKKPRTHLGAKILTGIFYGEAKIVTLWDNGRNPATQPSNQTKVNTWSTMAVGSLAENVLDTEQQSRTSIGTVVPYSCGKGCSQLKYEWENLPSEFAEDIRKNPELLSPPVAETAKALAKPPMSAPLP